MEWGAREGIAQCSFDPSVPACEEETCRIMHEESQIREVDMAVCDTCGNDYWLAFQVHTVTGEVHTFDSVECAAQRLAPICEHCGCRILGHGSEVSGRFYCCAHCAREAETEQAGQIRDTMGARPV